MLQLARFRSTRRTLGAGFTLTELMVALTGGLFITTIVFVLTRDSTRFYQRESRMAAATLSEIIGFQRLQSDLARAGFLASGNVRRDPNLCGDPVGEADLWPDALENLAAVRVIPGPAPHTNLATQVAPHAIVLAGSYASADQFPARTIEAAPIGYRVYLQVNSGPMARLRYPTGIGQEAAQVAALESVFQQNRALRIVDGAGSVQYGVITGVVGGAEPYITLAAAPPLRFKADGSPLCGLRGFETGALVNVVNFIRYDIRDVSAEPAFQRLFEATAEVTFATLDATRRDLVRVELDVAGNEIDGTLELVAEYAVDLRLGLTVVSNGNLTNPDLTTIIANQPNTPATNNPEVFAWAGLASGLANNRGPEFVRALRARLSVRSREPDRETNIAASTTVAPGLYRIGLGDGGTAPFARVRTMQADIALRNQR